MESPVIVLALSALIFGIFNIVLWLFIVRGGSPGDSKKGKSGDVQNLIFASEKRMIDSITKMFTTLKGPSGSASSVVDSKKIAAEISLAIKGQKQPPLDIPEINDIKKSVEGIGGTFGPVENLIKKNATELETLIDELSKQKEFIEAIDGHIVEAEKKSR